MIRLGLIGCGAWGWRYIPAALEAGNCEVVGVTWLGRHLPPEAEAFLVPVKHYGSITDMLAAPVDAFVVATHPVEHEAVCSKLARHGRPFMVEKPMALDLNAAKRIANEAEGASVPFLVNHQHLFAPAYEKLLEHLRFEDVRVASCGSGSGPVRDYSALWDYGPHDVSMYLGLLRNTTAPIVRAHMTTTGAFVLGMEDGERLSVLRVSNGGIKRRRFVAMRGSEVAVYDDLASSKLVVNEASIAISSERPLTRSVRAFAEAARTGKTDWRFGRFGVEVVRVLAEAEKQISDVTQ